jgi:hypothetical protein
VKTDLDAFWHAFAEKGEPKERAIAVLSLLAESTMDSFCSSEQNKRNP